MWPIITDRVARSVGRSVTQWALKTAEPIEMSFRVLIRLDPRNHVLDGGTDPPCEWVILTGKGTLSHARRHSDASCAKMAEPIDLPFGLTRVSRRKHTFNRIRHVAPMYPNGRAHWCHLTNTNDRPSAAAMRPYAKLLWPLVMYSSYFCQFPVCWNLSTLQTFSVYQK